MENPLSPSPATEPSLRRQRARQRLRRGIYVLPSLFTMGNIFLGFWAIIRGLRGDFGVAALAVAAAGILDGIDGRIARLTGTESEFGKEFDSLADVITFGVAPALLAFFWGLHEFPRVGWLVPLFYVVCGATRLARFNVMTKVHDKRFFAGLPIPAAAGTVASVLFFDPERDWRTWMSVFLLGLMVAVAILMVSTIRYRSFKQVDLQKRRAYRAPMIIATIFLLIAWKPQIALVSLALVYAASGPLEWLINRMRGHRGAPPPSTLDGGGEGQSPLEDTAAEPRPTTDPLA